MKCKLGDIVEVTMGQSPKSEFYNADGNGTPFLQGNRTFGSKYPTFDTFTTFVTKQGRAGDVIMSVRAPVGDVNITPVDICLGRGVCSLRMKNGSQEFLYYMMRHYAQALINRESGTVFGSVNKNDVNGLDVEVPSEETQRKIAAILSALDDKIELNRRINANLEQQAAAIFDKRFPEATEEIPDGWRRGCLLDVADYLNGLAMQKFRPAEDEIGLPVLKIKELRQGTCDTNSELCSPSVKPEYIVRDGDVVFSWSGTLLVDIWCGGDCGLNQHLFKVTSDKFDKWFYYLWTLRHLERFIAIAADKATTMGHIKRSELTKAEVLIPLPAEYKEIGAAIRPLYELLIANRVENRKLAVMRDALLPRLMSGEIDVSDISI